MKKTISILIMIVMLLPLVAMAIPAYAAESDAADGFDPTKVGNTVVDPTDNAEYVAKLVEEGYIPVVASKGNGKPSNAVLYTEIADDKCYYLYEDIVWEKSVVSAASGDTKVEKGLFSSTNKNEHPNGYLDDVVIDGCGHTITVKSQLSSKTYNITVRNVTFVGTLKDTSGGQKQHLFGQWNSTGYSRFENITTNVDIVMDGHKDAWQKSSGVLVYDAGNGSYFKNIYNGGTITLGSKVTKLDFVGGIVGRAAKTDFENVVNAGSIIINGATIDDIATIGGVVGVATDCSIKNAVQMGDIILDGCDLSTVAEGGTAFGYLGGVVGSLTGGKLENGANTGAIKLINGTKIPTTKVCIGGIAGYTENVSKISGFDVSGEMVICAGNVAAETYVGGVLGNTKSDITIEDCHRTAPITITKGGTASAIGGILATATGKVLLVNNCSNTGDITFEEGSSAGAPNDGGWGFGGIVGVAKTKDTEISYCDNDGSIVSAPLSYASATGGILGYQYVDEAKSLMVKQCNNTGNISNINNNSMNGGIVGGIRGVVNASVQGCKNSGDVTTDLVAAGWRQGVGGIVGVYGSVGNWMMDECKSGPVQFDLLCCINTGNITGNCATGGILGANQEMAEPIELINFNGCVNEGKVESTYYVRSEKDKVAYSAAGIYAESSGKGAIAMTYCVNKGEIIATNEATGLLGTPLAQMKSITAYNCKNSGNVSGIGAVGGIINKASNAAALVVEDCFNEGDIATVDAEGGLSSGIVTYTKQECTIKNCVNTGKITSGKPSAVAPITHDLTKVGEDNVNYYVKESVERTDVKVGVVKTADEIAAITSKVLYERMNNPYALLDVMADVNKLYQQDYTAATWVFMIAALRKGEAVVNDPTIQQSVIDSALEGLKKNIAELVTVAPDYTELNKAIERAGTYKAKDWSSLTFVKVTNAVTAAKELMEAADTLQSDADNAVITIDDAIAGLEERGKTQGGINVEENGQLQIGGTLRPVQTKPAVTEPVTEAPTEAPAEAPTEPVEESGCGGVIGGAAVVLVAVAAIGTGVSLKKREN